MGDCASIALHLGFALESAGTDGQRAEEVVGA